VLKPSLRGCLITGTFCGRVIVASISLEMARYLSCYAVFSLSAMLDSVSSACRLSTPLVSSSQIEDPDPFGSMNAQVSQASSDRHLQREQIKVRVDKR
jgi:hypothetical protein